MSKKKPPPIVKQETLESEKEKETKKEEKTNQTKHNVDMIKMCSSTSLE